jgi:hypothetical protein
MSDNNYDTSTESKSEKKSLSNRLAHSALHGAHTKQIPYIYTFGILLNFMLSRAEPSIQLPGNKRIQSDGRCHYDRCALSFQLCMPIVEEHTSLVRSCLAFRSVFVLTMSFPFPLVYVFVSYTL